MHVDSGEERDRALFRVSIPVVNYNQSGFYNVDLFFYGEKSPVKTRVARQLRELHTANSPTGASTQWLEALKVLESIPESSFSSLTALSRSVHVGIPVCAELGIYGNFSVTRLVVYPS